MFPSLSAAEVYAATAERWDTSTPFPLPRPGWLACPVCRTPEPQPRWWMLHSRPEPPATIPYRCDVTFKCVSCAAVWLHGVALTREAWEQRPNPNGKRGVKYTWREVQQILGM